MEFDVYRPGNPLRGLGCSNASPLHQRPQPLDRFDLFYRFVRAEIDDVEILPEQCPRHLFAHGTGACERIALTTAQARPLVARVLEDEQERKPGILSAIADHQQGNYAAYWSYRRRTLKRNV
jgi:hypothetical protein